MPSKDDFNDSDNDNGNDNNIDNDNDNDNENESENDNGNMIKQLNDCLGEIIDKSKSFEDQIKLF